MNKFLRATAILVMMTACAVASAKSNVKYINMFMGTAGDHGQTTPGACVPFGMVSVCPDSNPWQHSGYDYDVPEISGVSVNRISGTGCSGNGGNLSIKTAGRDDVLRIVKGTEKAVPGFYSTCFDNGSAGKFTATENMAVEQYVLSSDKIMYIDFLSAIDKRNRDCSFSVVDNRTIEGWVKSPTVCAFGSYVLYFQMTMSKPFTAAESSATDAVLKFDAKKVEVRVALSAVGVEDARAVTASWAGKSFNALSKRALSLWKEKIDRFTVEGASEEQKALFYTSLMRVYHSPWKVSATDGRFFGTDGKIHDSQDWTYYSMWSMWDTFRTKFPMLVLLEPAAMTDICNSLIELYANGKKNWATPYESGPTVRTEHTIIALLDAYRKGVPGINWERGYEGMKAEEKNDYLVKSPDQLIETAYDLWALAQVAEIAGHHDDAVAYGEKADKLFVDVWTREFQHVTPAFSVMKRNGLYQGTRWQFRWMGAEYMDKMIELHGKEKLCEELHYFFDNHLFNQGNEPDIQTPFIFNRLGDPEGTSQTVRSYIDDDTMIHVYGGNAEYPTPYVGRAFRSALDGYAPEMDEDDGAMSSWYMFCQLGLYPLVVGADSYELFSPIFDKVTIKGCGLNKDKTAVIRTNGRGAYGDPIKSISLNGKPVEDYSMTNDLFLNGGELVYNY